MKTEQEQIEKMAEMCCDIKENPNCKECIVSPLCGTKMDCTTLYKAGYRKASEVIDEFVERVKETALQSCHKIINCYEVTRIETVIDDIAAEMRQEVGK